MTILPDGHVGRLLLVARPRPALDRQADLLPLAIFAEERRGPYGRLIRFTDRQTYIRWRRYAGDRVIRELWFKWLAALRGETGP